MRPLFPALPGSVPAHACGRASRVSAAAAVIIYLGLICMISSCRVRNHGSDIIFYSACGGIFHQKEKEREGVI
jgi:hypothetical protein